MRTVVSIVILAFLIISCEKEINMKIPEKERKLTINAEFFNDSLIQVNISKSIGILEQDKEASFVSDAKVLLYENDNLLEQLIHVDSGNYISTYKAKQLSTYKIVVTHAIYPKAEATTHIPVKVMIDKIDTITKSSSTSNKQFGNSMDGNQNNLTQRLTFTDAANEENYYCLVAYGSYYEYKYDYTNYEITDSVLKTNKLYLSSTDPVIDKEYLNGNYLIFSDNLFNGKTYTIEFSLNLYSATSQDVKFELKSITKELYLYLISKQKNQYSGNDPFTESVTVYNNIDNGFGILGGSTSDVKLFKE